MPGGNAREAVERAWGSENGDPARSYQETVTVSGDAANGHGVSVPPDIVDEPGVEAGDRLRWEHGPVRNEAVLVPADGSHK